MASETGEGMITADILKRARDRWIAHPTRGEYARDASDRRVGPTDPDACTWCAVGAILCELGELARGTLCSTIVAICAKAFELNVFSFIALNDTGTLSVARWNEAIVRLGGEP